MWISFFLWSELQASLSSLLLVIANAFAVTNLLGPRFCHYPFRQHALDLDISIASIS